MGHDWKFIIGYYLEALVSTKVISLLNLWKWENQNSKQHWHGKLKKGDIIMFKKFDKLENLLK